MAKALSWVHNLPDEQRRTFSFATALNLVDSKGALKFYGFDRGGLLLVDTQTEIPTKIPPLLRRAEIAHKEKEAWAFVFHFPDFPSETPERLEQDRLAALLQAAPFLSLDDWKQFVQAKIDSLVAINDVVYQDMAFSWGRLLEILQLVGWLILLVGYFILFFVGLE